METKIKNGNFRSSCAVSCTLDLLGDKWTLLIVRDALFSGHTTFEQFLNSHEHISSDILTDRLDKLVRFGVFTRQTNQDGLNYDYDVTPTGEELVPVLLAMGKWGAKNIEGARNLENAYTRSLFENQPIQQIA